MKLQEKMRLFRSYIAQKGLKYTNQRDFIARTFFRVRSHISLDELFRRVRKTEPGIGYATVYRTMKILTDSGLAVTRQFGDGQTRYENLPEGGHHDHLICLKCSRIVEFQNQKIEDLQNETASHYGFTVISHKLELYGYCSACR
jgi:Fur family ferric uptake transcriptional regulator